MPRWATCALDDLHVGGSLGGGKLARGARIDLDAVVSPGVTWAQALGKFAKYFVVDAPTSATTPRRPGRPDKDE